MFDSKIFLLQDRLKSPARFASVHVVHPYSSTDIATAWKKYRFILSVVQIKGSIQDFVQASEFDTKCLNKDISIETL